MNQKSSSYAKRYFQGNSEARRTEIIQNNTHGITVVTQRNSWKSNIFGADSILKKKNIKRASNLLLTFYRKIRTLTMVIR